MRMLPYPLQTLNQHQIYTYIYIYIYIFDRGGAIVKGVTEKVGPMPGVCGGTGSEVIGGAPPDPSWDW